MNLYRILSTGERNDYENHRFRTAYNTLEAKQFFKSEIAVMEFYRESLIQDYQPPYSYMIVVDINEECLESVQYDVQELDRFEAITVFEADLPNFNDCINFVHINAL